MSAPPRRPPPRCEACGQEEAYSFSWFPDRAQWYAPRSGRWLFTGDCTSDTEHYYVLLNDRTNGFLRSAAEQRDWWHHLGGKDWFNPLDFGAMLDRFVAAGGDIRPGPRRRRRAIPPPQTGAA
jgi:hypothetical protein